MEKEFKMEDYVYEFIDLRFNVVDLMAKQNAGDNFRYISSKMENTPKLNSEDEIKIKDLVNKFIDLKKIVKEEDNIINEMNISEIYNNVQRFTYDDGFLYSFVAREYSELCILDKVRQIKKDLINDDINIKRFATLIKNVRVLCCFFIPKDSYDDLI